MCLPELPEGALPLAGLYHVTRVVDEKPNACSNPVFLSGRFSTILHHCFQAHLVQPFEGAYLEKGRSWRSNLASAVSPNLATESGSGLLWKPGPGVSVPHAFHTPASLPAACGLGW